MRMKGMKMKMKMNGRIIREEKASCGDLGGKALLLRKKKV